eukprot:jgi/Tetstr1/463509/TSEL_008388.t1
MRSCNTAKAAAVFARCLADAPPEAWQQFIEEKFLHHVSQDTIKKYNKKAASKKPGRYPDIVPELQTKERKDLVALVLDMPDMVQRLNERESTTTADELHSWMLSLVLDEYRRRKSVKEGNSVEESKGIVGGSLVITVRKKTARNLLELTSECKALLAEHGVCLLREEKAALQRRMPGEVEKKESGKQPPIGCGDKRKRAMDFNHMQPDDIQTEMEMEEEGDAQEGDAFDSRPEMNKPTICLQACQACAGGACTDPGCAMGQLLAWAWHEAGLMKEEEVVKEEDKSLVHGLRQSSSPRVKDERLKEGPVGAIPHEQDIKAGDALFLQDDNWTKAPKTEEKYRIKEEHNVLEEYGLSELDSQITGECMEVLQWPLPWELDDQGTEASVPYCSF